MILINEWIPRWSTSNFNNRPERELLIDVHNLIKDVNIKSKTITEIDIDDKMIQHNVIVI